MNSEPLVSVIMGAYNCERTLAESLESIFGQEYSNLEVVVCEDGSTDGTAAILESWAAREPRLLLLRNEGNRGLSYSLNRCVEKARGVYLARMDGDDRSRPGRIMRQVSFLEAHPEYAFCGCNLALFDSAGLWGELDYPERPEARDFLLRSPFAHPTVVFRAESLRKIGGYDSDPAIGRSEDYDLFMRLHAAGLRGYNLQERLFEYREELGSFRKRKYRFALTEARVRYRGFRRLGLLPGGLAYVVKPLLIGLLPKPLYTRIRKRVFGGKRGA